MFTLLDLLDGDIYFGILADVIFFGLCYSFYRMAQYAEETKVE